MGLVLTGAVAAVYSTPAAWILGAAFLVVAVFLIVLCAVRA